MAVSVVDQLGVACRSMTVERYAALERATGPRTCKVANVWWRQVRPFLYRPLLPYRKYDARMAADLSTIGAFQYAVEDGQRFNSYLNPIIFEDPHGYDFRKLRYSVQKHVNKARRNGLSVYRFTDEDEFVEKGHPCYQSFYERTRYSFDTRSVEKAAFRRWAHRLFEFPEVIVLGAFSGSELLSYEVACVVEDTLILKTLVNSDAALHLGASDLLLHTLRTSASLDADIHLIYDSMLGQRAGINEYYTLRGARVLALPAYLRLNPAMLWLIKQARSNVHKRLVGLSNHELEGLRSA